jgi:hypothetical protein
MRVRGKARSKEEVQRATPVRGDLLVQQRRSETFGRYSNVASFATAGAADQQPLPELQDVALPWMGPIGFVLSGIEMIDGIAYGQSWWCRPE